MPSITLPCLVSLMYSLAPAQHGVTTNDWQPLLQPVPGLIDTAHDAGRRCAFFYNWEPLRNLNLPGNLHHAFFMDNCLDFEHGDQIIADQAARYIPLYKPGFAFVYLGSLDLRGHADGWMSAGYLEQIERADRAVATVLDSLPPDTVVLVQSDHGGHGHDHGTDHPADMTIPWMIAGRGIRHNYAIQAPVTLLDTAPTLAYILGIAAPPAWQGQWHPEIFG